MYQSSDMLTGWPLGTSDARGNAADEARPRKAREGICEQGTSDVEASARQAVLDTRNFVPRPRFVFSNFAFRQTSSFFRSR